MNRNISKAKPDQIHRKAQNTSAPLFKRLYTLKEGAQYLGRSDWGMRELIWSGSIPVVRTEGGRKIFLDIEDLNDFINRNKSVYK
jgi:excisionase family DNA binding protein